MPKISVIVPIYNVEAYVEQCLDSILKQTIDDLEIICIDDGSTDRSGVLADRYARKDPRVKVIHKENTGYGNSMNIGLKHASGSYVAIIESDDFAEHNMLQKLYTAAVQNNADIVKGEYYRYQKGLNTYADRLRDYPKNTILSVEDCPTLLNLADTIWSCLYRRQFLVDNHITFHETPGASFQDISFALLGWLAAKRVYLIEDAMIHYRIDNPGSSMKNPGKIFCVFDEYKRAESESHETLNSHPLARRFFTASKYRDYLNHYYRVDAPFQYALLMRISEEFNVDMEAGRIDKDAFLDQVWMQIYAIYEDKNLFFIKTSKNNRDSRLRLCDFGNGQAYYRGVMEALKKFQEVVIYGAGVVGRKTAYKLLEEKIKLSCFTVTRKDGMNSGCMGLPVVELESLSDKADSCAVVIAVTETKQYELYCNLQHYHFKNIFRVDEVMKAFL